MLSVIIPACNEESVIDACLQSIIAQKGDVNFEIIVAANGCSDRTVECAESRLSHTCLPYKVLNLPEGNKNKALNAADQVAQFGSRLYLDADVVCSDHLLLELDRVLTCDAPVYATGTLNVTVGRSYASKAYAKLWQSTPYICESTPGCGCYAVNAAGRRLWNEFPTIHSDDKFVRLLFSRAERQQVNAEYFWPLPQGAVNLIKTRIRWNRGNRQLAASRNSRSTTLPASGSVVTFCGWWRRTLFPPAPFSRSIP